MLSFCLEGMTESEMEHYPFFLTHVLLTWRRASSARTQPSSNSTERADTGESNISTCIDVITQNVFHALAVSHTCPVGISTTTVDTAVPRTSSKLSPDPTAHAIGNPNCQITTTGNDPKAKKHSNLSKCTHLANRPTGEEWPPPSGLLWISLYSLRVELERGSGGGGGQTQPSAV